ncbi:MAG: phosphodiester glycosidase family protein [Candidatus Sericytochromatia bacterium]|nr:phosphodiester glycosidase family protein [Candidatus Sericytochromatia bacterium]
MHARSLFRGGVALVCCLSPPATAAALGDVIRDPAATDALPAAEVSVAEWRATAETVELRLPVPAHSEFDVWASEASLVIAVRCEEVPAGLSALSDAVLGPVSVARTDGGGFTLRLAWRHWCPVDVEPDGEGGLRVTVRKVYDECSEPSSVAPGVSYVRVRRADARGPVVAHVLRLEPDRVDLELRPVLARDGFAARETVTSMARRRGAVAAINGSFFSPRTGEPLGVLMVDGELISAPLFHRSALALGGAKARIGATALGARLTLQSGETYDLDGINQPRGLNRLVLYTPRFGPRTGTPSGGREWTVDRHGVVLGSGEADSDIPPNGRVLSAHGQAAEWLARRLSPGSRVKLSLPLAEVWPGARHVLGGGPALLDRGAIKVTAERERFRPDVANGRAPRTAVGIDPDGRLLLVAVDGRQPRYSQGVTLEELARLMRSLGASEAINLDGGGSTAMTIGDVLISRPSDGTERPVNNALLVVRRADAADEAARRP